MSDHLIQKILTARVYDVAIESPVHKAPFLSSRLGREVLYKREDLQPVYSFKCRGAYNKMLSIDPEVLSKASLPPRLGIMPKGSHWALSV